MYPTVTNADTAGEPLEHATLVVEEMDGGLRETDGFEGFLMLTGEQRAIKLAFWESREAAERHRLARTQFRERILSIAGVRIEEVVDYEVAFARLRAGLWQASSDGS